MRRAIHLIVAAACLVALADAALPALVRRAVVRALESVGFRDPTVQVMSLTRRALALARLRTEDAWSLRLERLDVAYTLWDLLHRRVDTVDTRGLSLTVPPMNEWPSTARFGASAASPAPLPFRRVVIENARIGVGPVGDIRIPMASLEKAGRGSMEFQAEAGVQGNPVFIDGRWRAAPRELDCSLRAPVVDLGAWSEVLAGIAPHIPLRIEGAARIQSILAVRGAATTASARVAGSNLTVTAESLRLAIHDIPSVTGLVEVADSRVRFEVGVEILQGLSLFAGGTRAPDGTLVIDRLATSGPGILDADEPGRRLSALRGLRLSGRPEIVSGRVEWNERGLTFAAEAKLHDIGLSTREGSLRVAGLNGSVAVRSGGMDLTDGEQVLSLDEIQIGNLRLTDGEVRFVVETNGTMRLPLVSFGWAGGRVGVRDVSISAAERAVTIRIEAEHVELKDLLPLASAGRVTGSGRVSGFWTLGIAWSPVPSVDFGEGRLTAEPGGGWFQVREPGGAVALVDTKIGRKGLSDLDQELTERITRAIYDFEFDDLYVEFSRKSGHLITAVHAKGRGPRGEHSLTFGGLTFNVTGLDDLIELLIVKSQESRLQLHADLEEPVRDASPDAPGPRDQDETRAVQRAIEDFF